MNSHSIIATNLIAEHYINAIGIDDVRPRLSWKTQSSIESWVQESYEIKVTYLDGTVSTSGRIQSSQSVYVEWPFEELKPRQQVKVEVKVTGTESSESAWSEPLTIEVSLKEASNWQANFIAPAWTDENADDPACPYLRRDFTLDQKIESARLYVTSLGLYQAYINGKVVGDHLFAPGWTTYKDRLQYQTYDVKDLLNEGENAIGAILSEGWFKGRLGFEGGKRDTWGDRLALLAQLEVTYSDGSKKVIASDENWLSSKSPIISSGIYDGETYDANLEQEGWNRAGFCSDKWQGIVTVNWDFNTLISPMGPPAKRIEEVKIVSISKSPSGKTLLDFGQNLVGRLRITATGKAGQTITMRHAEVLEKGELGVRPLRLAKATDRYTFKSDGTISWEPNFTFHGFRYAEIDGWDREIQTDSITAIVVHSQMNRTGWFDCDKPMMNRLHENVRWGMKGNFLHVPTDCPQRDERLGWTGDFQVFAPTASFLYDSHGFVQSWLQDIAVEQKKTGGMVPLVVPQALDEGFAAAAWGDAATIVPWVYYQRFGDKKILEDQYESMKAWVDLITTKLSDSNLWDKGFQFGDWLDPSAPPEQPAEAKTYKEIVATSYFIKSTRILSETAAILGDSEASQKYLQLSEKSLQAFRHEFIAPSGRMICDAHTAYALAIEFNLMESEEQRQRAGDRLAELTLQGGFTIQTGFVGTPLICDALSNTGHYKEAYQLFSTTECPSFLYPVSMGATTVWERWDSMLPDGSINPGDMTSFNHYALGAVADWMHRTIGGISLANIGFKSFEIAPRPGGGITTATVKHESPYGLIVSAWSINKNQFTLDVEVPPNTQAVITLPGQNEVISVGSGKYSYTIDYIDPEARGPYNMDDVIGDILIDEAAKEILFEVFDEVKAPPFLKTVVYNEKLNPLGQMLRLLPTYDKAVELLTDKYNMLWNSKNDK